MRKKEEIIFYINKSEIKSKKSLFIHKSINKLFIKIQLIKLKIIFSSCSIYSKNIFIYISKNEI